MMQKVVKLKRNFCPDRDKYITTPEFNNLAAVAFDERLKQADLVTKTNHDTKLKSLNQKKLTQMKQSIYFLNMNLLLYLIIALLQP